MSMEMCTMVTGKTIKLQVTEYTNILMAQNMKANG